MLVIALLGFVIGTCQSNDTTSMHDLLLQIESNLSNAIVANDTLIVKYYLHKDFLFTLSNGRKGNKDRYLNDMKAWWKPTSMIHYNQLTHADENLAIIMGEVEYTWELGGIEKYSKEQYTDVYIRKNQKFKKIGSHAFCLEGECNRNPDTYTSN